MEISNSDRQGWLNRGKILANLGRHKEALVCYEKAIEIKPDYYRLLDTVELIQELLQCLELAESDFGKALKGYKGYSAITKEKQYIPVPGNNIASSCYNWACLQALQGNVEQSVAYLEQALQLDGDKYRSHAKQDPDLNSIRDRIVF